MLEVEKTGNKVIIKPAGVLDFGVEKDFRTVFANKSPNLKYVIDMANVTFIASSGLGLLIILRNHTGERSDIQIINSSDNVRSVLKLAHFGNMFQIM